MASKREREHTKRAKREAKALRRAERGKAAEGPAAPPDATAEAIPPDPPA